MTTATKLILNLDPTKRIIKTRCGWCGGNLARDEDNEIQCIQCGRAHDKNGELVRHDNGHSPRNLR